MKKATILLAEDDEQLGYVIKDSLEEAHYKVILCPDGQAAIDHFDKRHIDLCLLDVMMPQMDGPSTLIALRDVLDVPSRLVLFMTAKVQQKEIDEYLGLGAQGVIIKPFDPMTLAKQIQDHWVSFQNSKG